MSRGDRELLAGSHAHYEDPDYYTATYAHRIDDVAFYVGLTRSVGGPVLEYGVGNGRIALPIARHGAELVGVDWSRPMIDDLRARLKHEPAEVRRRVRLVRGDMRRVRLGRRFPLVICTFNTALHLYTRGDVERFLARVRAHLTDRGRFVVDLSVPPLDELACDPAHPRRAPRFVHPSAGVMVKYKEHFDYDPARQVLFVSMEFEPCSKQTEETEQKAWVTPLAHRQFFPQEWEALLHYNGFDVERLEGDFQGGPLTKESDVMVWHATRQRTKR